MSAPNVDKPNESVLGQAANSVTNAAQYVSESIQGSSAEASKEANKEKAKGNVRYNNSPSRLHLLTHSQTPGDQSITDRISGATGAVSDKMDESKHDTAAKANKHNV